MIYKKNYLCFFFGIKMYSYFLELMYNVPQQYNDLKSHITEMTHFDGHN